MSAILHRVEIKTSPEKLYAALAEQSGLASWWTPMVETKTELGATAKFRFGDGSQGPDMKVTELSPNEKVSWRCVSGPWLGHDFIFDIQPHEKGSVLFFADQGWEEPSEFFMHCNSKWGFFLGVSLKQYLETGEGQPHPRDPDL